MRKTTLIVAIYYVILSPYFVSIRRSNEIFFQFLVSSQLISSCHSITNVSFFLIVFYAGSAVAVEHIFSGGHDTISLRRASLNPETIRTLMLVKQRLRLARTAIHDILRD